ncbi:thioesterase domain-containing protein [Lentzea kentuckyensis]|uniref:thioesterase domain-containing protein n=1 Tax=Lentzea kentuckyensis TaxID=360086 RepID=UPI000A36EC07|nr:thioesterase domain-containing protein [Lentzea kentuckyensis]
MTATRPDRPLLVRTPGRRGDPVVLIHPGAIPVSHYRDLAEGVDPVRELVIVDLEQMPAYFEAALTRRITTTIDEIAADVARELRTLPVAGTNWVLAGWSFGGSICHALLDLLDEDELPQRVLVLDALAPVPEFTARDGELDPVQVLGWFAMYLAAKRGGIVDVPPERLRGREFEPALAEVLDAAVAGGALLPGTTTAGLRKVFTTYRDGLLRNNHLVLAHSPKWTDVPVVVLRPERGLVDRPGALGWDQVAESPKVLRCPGDHYTMLRDPAAIRCFAEIAA